MAEEAIKQSENIKRACFSRLRDWGKMSSGKVEEMVESVHEVSKIDTESVKRMLTEIKRRGVRNEQAACVWRSAGGFRLRQYLCSLPDAMVTVGRNRRRRSTHDCFNRK